MPEYPSDIPEVRGGDDVSNNWVVENLENALETWNSKLSEIWRLLSESPSELIANCQYDILNYEGDIAAWDEMIAVYAVKLNLGDEPQEVATFDEEKAAELKAIFWDMNSISLRTESRTTKCFRLVFCFR